MTNFFCLAALIAALTSQNGNDSKCSTPSYVVKENETFKVELLSNPSTGYAWYIAKKGGSTGVDSVGHSYHVAYVGMPSTGGKETFEFKGVSKGISTLTLYYTRPWEKDKPAQVRKIVVEVK